MKRANDDMFIPVMPRILDPSLKFNEESILNSLEKSRTNFQQAKAEKSKEIITTQMDISAPVDTNKKSFITVLSKYKSYIFIVLGLVILVALVYYLYTKKFKKNKLDSISEDNNKSIDNNQVIDNSTSATEPKLTEENTKSKEEEFNNISNYLSNYIDTASESDSSEGYRSNIEVEDIESMVPPILVPIEEDDNVSEDDTVSEKNSLDFEEMSKIEELDDIVDEDVNTEEAEVVEEVEKDDGDETEEVDALLVEAEDPVDVFRKYTKS